MQNNNVDQSQNSTLGSCNIALVRLKPEKALKSSFSRAHQLRGAIAEKFNNEPIFHHHQANKLVYTYPLIQYRWNIQTGDGIVAGINQGAERILKVPWLDLALFLGKEKFVIAETEMSYRKTTISVSNKLERYHFLSPWLPFNQENYLKYQTLYKSDQRKQFDRLLIAQILMFLRGLQIEVKDHLYAAFELKSCVNAEYKEQNLMGFLGDFVTNLILPNDFSIGRSVSHGYGWFVGC